MEMSVKFILEILLMVVVLAVVLYLIIDKGILQGSNSIFDIGKCWMEKLFPSGAASACS